MDVLNIIIVILLILVSILLIFVLIKISSKNSTNLSIDTLISKIKIQFKDEFYNMNENINKKLSDNTNLIGEFKMNHLKDFEDYKTKTTESINKSYTDLLKLVNNQLNVMNNKVDEKLREGFKGNIENLEKVNKALGEITHAQKNLDNLNHEVSQLNLILNNSQKRGRFGEIALESILHETFGDTHGLYDLQYSLNNNSKPDAVIYMPEDKILCIDSKFSFINYAKLFDNIDNDKEIELKKEFKNSLKTQIKKISEYYIVDKVTEMYALMFIPSDAIYGFIQSDDDLYELLDFARRYKVILTSPSTLQAVLHNIRILRINYDIAKNIKVIVDKVYKFKDLIVTFDERWLKLSSSIDALTKKKDEFNVTVNKISTNTNQILEIAQKKNLLEES